MAVGVNISAPQFVRIGELLIDVVKSEQHDFEDEVTDFPMESGSSFTDNIRLKPIGVSMTCVISATPIGAMADIRKRDSSILTSPDIDGLAYLLELRNKRKFIAVETTIKTYGLMMIKGISIPRDSSRGPGMIEFTITLQEAQVVENKRFPPVSTVIAKNGDGKKITKPVTEWVSTNVARYIVPKYGEWFDPTVGCYRKGALPPTSSNPRWQLYYGRILCLSQAQWEGRTTKVTSQKLFGDIPFPALETEVHHPSNAQCKRIVDKLIKENPKLPRIFRATHPSDVQVLVSADLWEEHSYTPEEIQAALDRIF